MIAALAGSEVVSLAVGLLELALVAIVLRHLGRFRRSFPWLAALLLFFLVRGSARIYDAFSARGVGEIELAFDGLIVLVLLLLIAGIGRTATALKLALDEAALREREYARALADYRRLARHRLANPLTAIIGGVDVLEELPNIDTQTRQALLRNIRVEAVRLRHVSLDPQPINPEERALRPRPASGVIDPLRPPGVRPGRRGLKRRNRESR